MSSLARLIALAIRNPVVTAASFIAVVVLFTTLVVVSYPDSDVDQVLPVVEARTDYKVAPDFESGMEIAHQDSTVYDVLRASQTEGGIENLLAATEPAAGEAQEFQTPPTKDEMLAAQSSAGLSDEDRALLAMLSEELDQPVAAPTPPAAEEKVEPEKMAKPAPAPAPPVPAVTPKTKPTAPAAAQPVITPRQQEARAVVPAPQDIPPPTRNIEISRVDPATPAPTMQPVETARAPQSMSQREYAPGTSPDTLEFVRSVLDQKDNRQQQIASADAVATQMNAIQPTAGTPGDSLAPPREHYVQLGSVRSEQGAESEWKKLQAAFSSELIGAPHRVTKADLGEKGVFYRIQAGPFTADRASAVCASIKTQKPNGCLVIR